MINDLLKTNRAVLASIKQLHCGNCTHQLHWLSSATMWDWLQQAHAILDWTRCRRGTDVGDGALVMSYSQADALTMQVCLTSSNFIYRSLVTSTLRIAAYKAEEWSMPAMMKGLQACDACLGAGRSGHCQSKGIFWDCRSSLAWLCCWCTSEVALV